MENKIPTAKEYSDISIEKYIQYLKEYKDNKEKPDTSFEECLIEFAKLHVQEALKQASEKAELDLIREYTACEISKNSILNAYSLDNIK